MKELLNTISGLVLLLFVSASQANLIVNGGFEDKDVPDGKWKWFSSSEIEGWQGSNIEIWDSYGSVEAFEGEQLAELNAHPNSTSGPFSIYQTIETSVDALYEVSFAYRARANSNEAFSFDVLSFSNENLFSDVIDDHSKSGWSFFSTQFTAIDAFTTISFTAITTGTVGNFLDDVSVFEISNAVAEVPAPGAFMLVLGAVVIMGFRRYLMAKDES